MARYHFRLASQDVLRKLVSADLDDYEQVLERAELLGRLLLLIEDDWYMNETDSREIIVADDKGFDVLALKLSALAKGNSPCIPWMIN